MTERFPADFLWGAATSAHQVEGGNVHSDWWAWETRPDTTVAEPSGSAIEHLTRYAEDIGLLASLGLNAYRFSVEWARIEPAPGQIDVGWLDHYRRMVQCVRDNGMTPVVTLHHFTLPQWVAERGGWLDPGTPPAFARHCRRVVEHLGDAVAWWCTINEPGIVAFGGYLAPLHFPPGHSDYREWQQVIAALCRAHVLARTEIKRVAPASRVGATHAMIEWHANAAGGPMMRFLRQQNEDRFLAASADDDFIGVQTYTRQRIDLPLVAWPAVRALVGIPALRRRLLPTVLRRAFAAGAAEPQEGGTDMGWEYRPLAIAATVRRAWAMFPGRPILVTENGIATGDDEQRQAFIVEALRALLVARADGVELVGYVYWSAFDNFEWAHGFAPRFGLVGVDRATQRRTVKPSAQLLGEIARTGLLPG